jgi:hypothetical protein
MAGRIWAPADPARCQRNQWVALQRARPGTRRFGTFKWVRTGVAAFTLTTRVTRSYVYRAVAPQTPRCLGAVSRAQRVTVTGA